MFQSRRPTGLHLDLSSWFDNEKSDPVHDASTDFGLSPTLLGHTTSESTSPASWGRHKYSIEKLMYSSTSSNSSLQKPLPKTPDQIKAMSMRSRDDSDSPKPISQVSDYFSIKASPGRRARKSKSTTALANSFHPTLQESPVPVIPSLPTSDCESPISGRPYGLSSHQEDCNQRAEHVIALKKRDLTSDVSAQRIGTASHQSCIIATECLSLIHESLDLPSLPSSRRASQASTVLTDGQRSQEAKIDDQLDASGRTLRRKGKVARLDETNSVLTFKQTRMRIRRTPSVQTTFSGSYAGAPIKSANTKAARGPSPFDSISVDKPTTPTIITADSVLVEVLRRVSARLETSAEDERVPVMNITESLTREVLCICKELTSGSYLQVV